MKKRIISSIFAIVMVISLMSGCASTGVSTGTSNISTSTGVSDATGSSSVTVAVEPVHLTLAHADTEEGSLFGTCMTAFKKIVEEKSNGSIIVDIYPNGQLGTVSEYVTGIQNGTIDLAPAASTFVANFCTNVSVFDLPFLFENYDHVWKTLDGEVGDLLTNDLKNNGIIALDWWGLGFRNVTTSEDHTINSLADFKGFRIRTMQSAIHQALFQALGADAVPMDWSELYTALQQGTVDGQENPYTQILSSKIYEVNPVIVKTEHAFTPSVFMMSPSVEKKLSADQLDIIYACAKECSSVFRQTTVDINNSALESLTSLGCTFVDSISKADLQAATAGVYDQFPQYADLVSTIKGLA